MADNFGGSENIFFFDDANIVVIDPNSVIDSNGQKKDRVIKQENLVMYANLEVDSVPRSQLAVGQSLESGVQNVTLASINFLKPQGKDSFDTSYTDQFTGGINSQGQINQRTFDNNQNPQQTNYVDTQLLGIKNISVDIKFNGIPTVTMQLIDIQGKALFETGGNSPYSVFFYYPYPIFHLTLKGFYGKAIKYDLMLTSFNASFETSTGNYIIDLKFIARTSAILDDIRLGYLFALPNMYPIYKQQQIQTSDTSQQATASVQQIGTGLSNQTTVVKTSKGYSKLEQVFQEYRDKGLIDKSVPTLTLEEMSINLTKYTQFINQQFEFLNFDNLLYLSKYNESLKSFNNEINQWSLEYIDTTDVLVLNKNQTILYGLKNPQTVETAENKLKSILERYNLQISSIPIFGQSITYPSNFYSINSFKDKFIKSDINFPETYKRRIGTGNLPTQYENEIVSLLENKGTLSVSTNVDSYNPYYYTFNVFDENYIKQTQQVEDAKIKESENLNTQLQNTIKQNSNSTNLPFRPTIRNVMGVIMASVDAFYRMMYDVQLQAWAQKDNKERINSIIKSNTPSQEGKDAVISSQSQNITNIVYPWPQFVQKTDINGKSEYIITYPGSKSVENFTKGYNSTTWPEVEFVEQFLYGLTVKDLDYNSNTQPTPTITLNYTPSSAIEIEFKNTIYNEKDTISFPYELYERILLNTFYSGLYFYPTNRVDLLINSGTEIEVENVFNSGIPNGELRDVIINDLPQKTLYEYFTQASNNGTGTNFLKLKSQEFTTEYINTRVQKSNELFSTNTYKNISKQPKNILTTENIRKFLEYETKETILDTFPFNVEQFQTKLESPTIDLFNTKNTYTLDSETITITNQKSILLPFNKKESSIVGFNDTNINNNTINTFYRDRFLTPSKRMLTESNVVYTDSNRVTTEQTTSMLNTPYFLNSLLSASTITGDTKFIVPAYLFLNSLPLNTLYEKYLGEDGKKKDFIFPSLTKFSSSHKLPYAWILKIGSVWYRYKKYINDGIDILDDGIWNDFNYKYAYDPQTLNINKVYNNITVSNGTKISNFTLDNPQNIRIGFYPGLYDSVYKLITGSNLYDADINKSNETLSSNESNRLKIIEGQYNGVVAPLIPYYTYLNITSEDTDKGLEPNYIGKMLVFPSAGYTPFLQSAYQYSRSDNDTSVTKQDVNKIQMFNGSAKVFWEAPNYGWFDCNQISKPNYDQYLKYIKTGVTQQQDEFILTKDSNSYYKIEDLFGSFSKEQLDLFETEFENFCKDEVTKGLFDDNNDAIYSNFRQILKNILIIDNKNITDSLLIAKEQTKNINGIINSFLNINVYLKIGNPREFNRKYFGSFIDDNNLKLTSMIPNPNPKNTYGNYITGSLPGDGSPTTITESQLKYPDAWKALKLNVGFSTINGLEYGSNSYITDFFIDNNISFTVDNIINLSKLIKIYATQKRKNSGNYDSIMFKEDIKLFYEGVIDSRDKIERAIRTKLPNKISSNVVPEQITIKKVEGDNTKLEMWEVFKSINDKWVSGIDFTKKILFDEFLFFDRANRDIGDTFLINVESIRKYCSWENSNTSVMSLIRQLVAENKMNFFVLPAYINFYGKPSRATTNRNQTILNNANDVFSTFGYVDYIDSAPKFLCQYVGRPSNTLSMDNDPKYPFKSDSFDLGISAGNPIRNTSPVNDEYKNNKAVGFVVDFGVTNQNVFKSFEISQNQNVTSSEQIQVIVDMGRLGANKKVSQQTTALYELYKSRTYDCTLKTFGNVMLQPTMYFVVRHMPMFNGTYVIRNVKHDIGPGVFNTTIQGQRISSLSNQIITNELASINEDFTKKLDNKITTLSSNNNLITLSSKSNVYLTGQTAKDLTIQSRVPYQGGIDSSVNLDEQTCQENIWGYSDSSQSKLPNQPYVESTIGIKELINLIKENESDKTMRLFLFSLFYLSGYKVSDKLYKIKMNNLFGATADIKWNILNNFNGYRCLNTKEIKPVPYLSFENISNSIKSTSSFFEQILKSYTTDSVKFPCINENTLTLDLSKESNKDCYAKIFVALWYDKWYKPNSSESYDFETNTYLGWFNDVKYSFSLASKNNLI